jgi:plasmid stabilization system protein ParE
MQYRVEITAIANASLETILAYYAHLAGADVTIKNLDAMLESLATLNQYPLRCRVGRVANTYEHVFSKLPYIAVFSIAPNPPPVVQVLDIVHTARLYP